MIERLYFGQRDRPFILERALTVNTGFFVPAGKCGSQALQRDRTAHEQQAEVHNLQQRYGSLTAREQEVMTLVVSGMLNKQIAGEIGAGEPTVKIHRGNVMRKMEAGSVVDLVRMADKLKLSPRK
jgi:FixJ family two-component response regulator